MQIRIRRVVCRENLNDANHEGGMGTQWENIRWENGTFGAKSFVWRVNKVENEEGGQNLYSEIKFCCLDNCGQINR